MAPSLLVNSTVMAGATPRLAQTSLLHYTVDGHVLGFAPDKVYLAGLDHALTVEFSGGQGVVPVGVAASTANTKPGSAPALGRVTYQGVWRDVDVIYSPAQGGLVEATYVVHPNALPYGYPFEIQHRRCS